MQACEQKKNLEIYSMLGFGCCAAATFEWAINSNHSKCLCLCSICDCLFCRILFGMLIFESWWIGFRCCCFFHHFSLRHVLCYLHGSYFHVPPWKQNKDIIILHSTLYDHPPSSILWIVRYEKCESCLYFYLTFDYIWLHQANTWMCLIIFGWCCCRWYDVHNINDDIKKYKGKLVLSLIYITGCLLLMSFYSYLHSIPHQNNS